MKPEKEPRYRVLILWVTASSLACFFKDPNKRVRTLLSSLDHFSSRRPNQRITRLVELTRLPGTRQAHSKPSGRTVTEPSDCLFSLIQPI